MKISVKRKEQVEVSLCEITADVRYDEEDMPNNFPGRDGDTWRVSVNVNNGDLCFHDRTPFPRDVQISLHMKVCDSASYRLLDDAGEEVAVREQDYVPGFFPGSHFGDYIIFEIADGKVTNWEQPTEAELSEDFLGE